MRIVLKKTQLTKISLILYIFLFIYAPPIFPKINLILIQFVYSLFCILYFHKKRVMFIAKKIGMYRYVKQMLVAYSYIVIIMVVFCLIDFVGLSNYILTLYRFILIIPIMITCILYIILRCYKNNYSYTDIIECILYAGLIQSIISIFMFLIPSFRELIINIMYTNTADELLTNLWYLQRRCYAFANSIVDSLGYGSGLIAGIALYYGVFFKRKMLVYVPFLLIVPLLNARTGLVMFAIVFLLLIIYFIINLKISKFLLIFAISIIFLFLFQIIMSMISSINEFSVEWINEGINEIISIFTGAENTTKGSVEVLFESERWYLPNIGQLIIGTGHNVYGANGYLHSDVGYINDLWLGGIIGTYLLYKPLFYLAFNKIKSHFFRLSSIIPIVLISCFLVANIKGYMINYNPGMAVTLLLLFSFNLKERA